MTLPEEEGTLAFLIQCTSTQFLRFAEEAEQYRIKHAERRRADITREEKRAWLCGMEKLAGHEPVFRLG